jgi:antitoxin PrlF
MRLRGTSAGAAFPAPPTERLRWAPSVSGDEREYRSHRIIVKDYFPENCKLVSRKTVGYILTMNRQSRPPSAFSKVSVKSQTVIPREVRERLDLKPGDTLRYRVTGDGVLLDKAPANEADDPFATFSEWSNEADEKAYGRL